VRRCSLTTVSVSSVCFNSISPQHVFVQYTVLPLPHEEYYLSSFHESVKRHIRYFGKFQWGPKCHDHVLTDGYLTSRSKWPVKVHKTQADLSELRMKSILVGCSWNFDTMCEYVALRWEHNFFFQSGAKIKSYIALKFLSTMGRFKQHASMFKTLLLLKFGKYIT